MQNHTITFHTIQIPKISQHTPKTIRIPLNTTLIDKIWIIETPTIKSQVNQRKLRSWNAIFQRIAFWLMEIQNIISFFFKDLPPAFSKQCRENFNGKARGKKFHFYLIWFSFFLMCDKDNGLWIFYCDSCVCRFLL